MATEERLRNLTGMVLEALNYQRYGGGNDNPALGRAIQYVDDLLLPWARSQAGDELDVDNLVADAGLKMLRVFPTFRGTSGREFFSYMKATVERGIARTRRLLEARAKGCQRRAISLERNAEAARLAERLATGEPTPDIAAIIRENAQRLRLAMRGLTVDQQRVVRLHGIDDRPFQEIGAKLGHTASWAYDVWEAAATEIRRRLMRARPMRRRSQAPMAVAAG